LTIEEFLSRNYFVTSMWIGGDDVIHVYLASVCQDVLKDTQTDRQEAAKATPLVVHKLTNIEYVFKVPL